MITDLTDLDARLGQYESGMILVGPLQSLSINSTFRYFYIAGNGSRVYQAIGLGFVDMEMDAQSQRADIVEKLKQQFADVTSFDSHLEMAQAVHTRWPNEETARVLAFAAREAKSQSTDVLAGDYGDQLGEDVTGDPFDLAKDRDTVVDAPPLMREQGQPAPVLPFAATQVPLSDRTFRRSGLPLTGLPLSGDPAETRQQPPFEHNQDDFALGVLRSMSVGQGEAVPRLPVHSARNLAALILPISAVGVAIALLAWAIFVPRTGQVADKAAPAPIPKPSISSDEATAQAAAAALPLVADELTKANKLAQQPAPAPAMVPPAPLSQPSQVASGQAGAASIAEAQSPPATASIAEAQSPPAKDGPATRQIDAEEIASLINRGKDFLQSGDFASARLLLRRAAEAGDASAALLLGSTFDPRVIQQLHAVGIPADVAQARQWYQKAAELGSAAAVQQLAKLGQTGQ